MSLLPNVEEKDQPADSQTSHDLDLALFQVAEGMKFDWPESLPVERMKTGISEIALAFILFVALLAFFSVGRLRLQPLPRDPTASGDGFREES